MNENNLLYKLIKLVDSANELKIEYGITGQEVNKLDNSIITFSYNTTVEVNYNKKVASKTTIRSDFLGTITTESVFENCKEEIRQTDSNTKSETCYLVEFTKEDYDKLFTSGGKLYPLQLKELIPVDSQMNNKNCQVCYPSNKLIESITGHVKSTYAIYQKSEDYYDITMILNQLDERTEIPIIQYCNTKIYIID